METRPGWGGTRTSEADPPTDLGWAPSSRKRTVPSQGLHHTFEGEIHVEEGLEVRVLASSCTPVFIKVQSISSSIIINMVSKGYNYNSRDPVSVIRVPGAWAINKFPKGDSTDRMAQVLGVLT